MIKETAGAAASAIRFPEPSNANQASCVHVLQAAARDVAKSRAGRSRLRKWYDAAVLVRQFAKMPKRQGDGYVTFVGTA